MNFGKSLLIQVVGGILTLFIASIAKIIYETYIKSPTGDIEMSFFQMLLSIIGLFIFVNAVIWGSLAWKSRSSINKSQQIHTSIFKYASHPEQLRIISSEGKELVGTHAGNILWREAADAICKGMGLKHLRYSNIGTTYHLCDIENGKDIEIPTDNRIESKVEESGLRNGQILAVIENS